MRPIKPRMDENVLVICPFYKRESQQVIYCEGVNEKSVIHLAFARKEDCRMYEKQFCRKDWQQCMIAETLDKKWRDNPGK